MSCFVRGRRDFFRQNEEIGRKKYRKGKDVTFNCRSRGGKQDKTERGCRVLFIRYGGYVSFYSPVCGIPAAPDKKDRDGPGDLPGKEARRFRRDRCHLLCTLRGPLPRPRGFQSRKWPESRILQLLNHFLERGIYGCRLRSFRRRDGSGPEKVSCLVHPAAGGGQLGRWRPFSPPGVSPAR